MTRIEVFQLLDRERKYQEEKWGDLDERNNVGDFLCYMKRYYDAAVVENNPDSPYEALRNIAKVGALCVACLEKFGRV